MNEKSQLDTVLGNLGIRKAEPFDDDIADMARADYLDRKRDRERDAKVRELEEAKARKRAEKDAKLRAAQLVAARTEGAVGILKEAGRHLNEPGVQEFTFRMANSLTKASRSIHLADTLKAEAAKRRAAKQAAT
jgi:hypothetical protein